MSLPDLRKIEGIVVDIEGTTTPISFVYDVLFPFAREHASSWLKRHAGSDAGNAVLNEFRELADSLRADGHDVPTVPTDPAQGAAAAAAVVEHLMDRDSKHPALKNLQGKVWVSGYESGELRGVVWPDVVEAFERWRAAGKSIWIYSSGSVSAQKLLFGHSDQGDLLGFIDGHFDATTGPKKVASSYETIAGLIGESPDKLLFATDNLEEAVAADEAGWHVVVLRRPGNPDVDDHSFEEAETFDELP